jgi:hypothetical protein
MRSKAAGGSAAIPARRSKRPIGDNGTARSATTGPERTYFRVPFAEKDQAKALGMRFDGAKKQWYAPDADVAAAAKAVFPS